TSPSTRPSYPPTPDPRRPAPRSSATATSPNPSTPTSSPTTTSRPAPPHPTPARPTPAPPGARPPLPAPPPARAGPRSRMVGGEGQAAVRLGASPRRVHPRPRRPPRTPPDRRRDHDRIDRPSRVRARTLIEQVDEDRRNDPTVTPNPTGNYLADVVVDAGFSGSQGWNCMLAARTLGARVCHRLPRPA